MDWHRYMKQKPLQVLIWTSNYAFVASHMVVYVFTVLVGTSHNLFWNTISAYMSHCGATLIAFLSTFRYVAKITPIQDYCWYWSILIPDSTSHKCHHFIVSAKAGWKGGELPPGLSANYGMNHILLKVQDQVIYVVTEQNQFVGKSVRHDRFLLAAAVIAAPVKMRASCSLLRVSVKPGLWTMDWTMDSFHARR